MKLLVTLLVALVLILGCGAAEEPVADIDTEVVVEEIVVIEEEVVEIEEVAGLLPESWPQEFNLPENMIVVEELEEEGQPVVLVQFVDGVEPLEMADMYNHFAEGAVGEDWEIPFADQNDCYSTSADFYVAIAHPDYRYMTIEGYNDVETTIPTLKLTWLN